MDNDFRADDIVKRRSIFYKAFGIYGELAGFYDYGPIGLAIKRGIEGAWREAIVSRHNFIEVETTNIAPEQVFRASGHLSTFTDPVAVCKTCGTANRADKLLEQFYHKKKDTKSIAALRKMQKKDMENELSANKIRCERCGGELGKIEDMNLMFKSSAGHGKADTVYLRPETAQGIFIDFKDLYRLNSLKLPCGICQSGKAYRNEISPRQQLVRMREFTQLETELFYDPKAKVSETAAASYMAQRKVMSHKIMFADGGKKPESITIGDLLKSGAIPNEYFAFLVFIDSEFMKTIGFDDKEYWFRRIEKEELPHYSKCNLDVEIETSYGTIEVTGIADRGTHDLESHAKESGADLSVMNGEAKVLPSVVELSIGLDRLLLALLDKKVVDDKERGWKWLKLEQRIAPYDYSVFPLQKDDKLAALAEKVLARLRSAGLRCNYSESASIGKRYAKSDEIGVKHAITVDYQSLEDGTVTIRDRDTAEQKRIKWDQI